MTGTDKRKYNRIYYEAHREELRTRQRARYAKNRERDNGKMREYYARFRDVIRDQRLRRSYNITQSEYAILSELQGGVCAICYRPEPRKNGKLHVDHSHTHGNVRGLLCGRCNTGIGLFQDDISLLISAIQYLDGQNDPRNLNQKENSDEYQRTLPLPISKS